MEEQKEPDVASESAVGSSWRHYAAVAVSALILPILVYRFLGHRTQEVRTGALLEELARKTENLLSALPNATKTEFMVLLEEKVKNHEGFVDGAFHDAWGSPMVFELEGSNYTWQSAGKDGIMGNDDDFIRLQ